MGSQSRWGGENNAEYTMSDSVLSVGDVQELECIHDGAKSTMSVD